MSIIQDVKIDLGKASITKGNVLVVLVILIGAVFFIHWRIYHFTDTALAVVSVISVLLVITGYLNYRLLSPLYLAWMLLGMTLGWLVFRTLLIISFVLFIVPTNIILRILGKDLLNLKDKEQTHWIKAQSQDTKRYLKKF